MLRRALCYRKRPYSTIPFDNKPFRFTRFEPCCPDSSQTAANGYVPCHTHPIPNVLGKKVEMIEPLTGPNGLRHLVACIGPDALEWTRAKVEAHPGGIVQSIDTYKNSWLRQNTTDQNDRAILTTVADRLSSSPQAADILMFPEFKIYKDVQPDHLNKFHAVLNNIWKDASSALPLEPKNEDIVADTVILVCTHGRRDLRCGRIGPPIVEEFERVIKEKNLTKKVEVWGTSHFGG
ncbi:Sucrase/ferredoxin-like-domain-containing protein [Sporodiniella umbellata]|nr:Sucrase/ferredoxin-like-domain-containing protein [Sporodiniella umbellata]